MGSFKEGLTNASCAGHVPGLRGEEPRASLRQNCYHSLVSFPMRWVYIYFSYNIHHTPAVVYIVNSVSKGCAGHVVLLKHSMMVKYTLGFSRFLAYYCVRSSRYSIIQKTSLNKTQSYLSQWLAIQALMTESKTKTKLRRTICMQCL